MGLRAKVEPWETPLASGTRTCRCIYWSQLLHGTIIWHASWIVQVFVQTAAHVKFNLIHAWPLTLATHQQAFPPPAVAWPLICSSLASLLSHQQPISHMLYSLHDNPKNRYTSGWNFSQKAPKWRVKNDMLQLIACFSLCGELSLWAKSYV